MEDRLKELERSRVELIPLLRKEILKKAGNDFINIPYVFEGKEKKISIPRAPFHYWIVESRRGIGDFVNKLFDKLLEEEGDFWEPVSYSGLKMINDSPFHSDWVIAIGYDPEEWYAQVAVEPELIAIDEAISDYVYDFSIALDNKVREDEKAALIQ